MTGRDIAVFLSLTALAAGCTAPAPSGEPLVDPALTPDVLFESRVLSRPAALDGNRFLLNWWPRLPEALTAGARGARLEIAHLRNRDGRRLILETETHPDSAATIRVIEES